MTKWLHSWIFFAVVLVSFGAVGTTSLVDSQLPDTSDENIRDLHLIVSLNGQVMLKRQGWSIYAPVKFGATVKRGDLLQLQQSSKAIIACSDLTVYELHAGIQGVPCSSQGKLPTVLIYGGNPITVTRATITTEYPVVVSPRKTKVLAEQPTLKWTQVAGVETFTITLRGSGLNWTTTISSVTQISYPTTAPRLVRGKDYKLTVAAGGRSSDDGLEPDLGFTLLTKEAALTIQETEDKIKKLALPNEAREFLTAHFYGSQGLNAEAVERFEKLSNSLKEASVFRSLGDLYLKAGLYRFAEDSYLQALKISHPTDLEGQALAHNILGIIYGRALGNEEQAVQHLQAANRWYRRLGDSTAAKKIQGELVELGEK